MKTTHNASPTTPNNCDPPKHQQSLPQQPRPLVQSLPEHNILYFWNVNKNHKNAILFILHINSYFEVFGPNMKLR